MAMELQLSTSKARAEVAAMNAALGTLSAGLNAVGPAVAPATAAVNQFATALGQVKAPAGLAGVEGSFKKFSSGVAGAKASLAGFGASLGSANSLMNAFGVSLGAIGVAKFVKSGYDLVNVTESFKTVVGATAGGVKVAEAELAHITATALRLRVDIGAATDAYGKFLAAQVGAGQSVAESRVQFTKLSEVFRVMNLNADQSKRAFNAVTQMVSKGTISMEELRQQLGETVPAFNALAQALGVSTQDLNKMIAAGEVLTADALPRLIERLHETYVTAESLAQAGNKPAAVFQHLANSIGLMSQKFMEGFGEQALGAIARFADTLQKVPVQQFMASVGTLVGLIARGLVEALNIATQALGLLAEYIHPMAPAVIAVGVAFAMMVGPIMLAVRAVGLFSGASVALKAIPFMLTAIAAGWRMIAGAAGMAMAAMGPWGKIFAAVAIGVFGIATAFDLMTSEANAAEGTMKEMELATEKANQDMKIAQQAAGGAGKSIDGMGDASGGAAGAQSGLGGSLSSTTGAMKSQTAAAYELAAALKAVNSASGGGGGGGGSYQTGDYESGYSDAEIAIGDGYVSQGYARENYYDGMTGLPVGTPSDYYETGGSFALGGISHMGAPATTKVRSGMYNAAPKLNTGTPNTNNYVPTAGAGGIPAVLHPNEAVVPLPSGGQIPVQMGGAMSTLAGYAKEQCTILKNINQKMSIHTEAIIANGVILKTEFDRTYICLQAIEGFLFRILEVLGKLSTSGGGFGGGGGGGGGGFSGGGGTLPSDLYLGVKAMPGQGYSPGQLGFTGEDGSIYAQSKMARINPKYLNPGGRGFKPEYAWMAELLDSNGVRGRFATGSPNASKDMDGNGGFMAMLHPNEAVIPLPDGRSVPVDLGVGSGLVEMLEKMQSSTEVNGGPNGSWFKNKTPPKAGVTIGNVTVKIVTPNPESFNRSQAQVAQQMERTLRQATERIGQDPTFDDPTRRQE